MNLHSFHENKHKLPDILGLFCLSTLLVRRPGPRYCLRSSRWNTGQSHVNLLQIIISICFFGLLAID